VSFAPEGFHIMLMQPTRDIQPGDHVLLTLRFADGQSLQVQFEVRRPDGSAVKRATDATRRVAPMAPRPELGGDGLRMRTTRRTVLQGAAASAALAACGLMPRGLSRTRCVLVIRRRLPP
jgi:hypothetical protein